MKLAALILLVAGLVERLGAAAQTAADGAAAAAGAAAILPAADHLHTRTLLEVYGPGQQPGPQGPEPCPVGHAKAGPGAFLCLLCQNTGPSGGQRYQPRTGQSACLECPVGGSVNDARTVCTYYGPGQQPGPGATVENCPAGYAKAGPGAFKCTLCQGVGPNGGQRYQPGTGQSVCLECLGGRVNAARTVCSPVPPPPGMLTPRPPPSMNFSSSCTSPDGGSVCSNGNNTFSVNRMVPPLSYGNGPGAYDICVASGAARGQVWGVAGLTGIVNAAQDRIGSRPDVAALIASCVGGCVTDMYASNFLAYFGTSEGSACRFIIWCGQSTLPKNVTTCMMGADSEFGLLGGFGGDGGRLPGGGVQCNNLFSTVLCAACPANCNVCVPETMQCVLCNDGYTLSGGGCVPAPGK